MPNCLKCCYCEVYTLDASSVVKCNCPYLLHSMTLYDGQEYLALTSDCDYFDNLSQGATFRIPQPATPQPATTRTVDFDNLPTCPMCNTPQWKEGVCPTCIIRLKEAEEILAKFKQTQKKSKPKIVLGQRKVQLKLDSKNL